MTEIEALRKDLADAVRDRQLLAAEGDKMQKRIAELEKRLAEEEVSHEATIRQRDFSERWADKLASGVGDIEVIGEHSNLNNPWETAYGLMRSLAEFNAVEAERDRMAKEIERLRAALATVKADLLVRADRQDAFAEPTYTQLTDADRAMYRHAANMLRLAAEAMKETPQ